MSDPQIAQAAEIVEGAEVVVAPAPIPLPRGIDNYESIIVHAPGGRYTMWTVEGVRKDGVDRLVARRGEAEAVQLVADIDPFSHGLDVEAPDSVIDALIAAGGVRPEAPEAEEIVLPDSAVEAEIPAAVAADPYPNGVTHVAAGPASTEEPHHNETPAPLEGTVDSTPEPVVESKPEAPVTEEEVEGSPVPSTDDPSVPEPKVEEPVASVIATVESFEAGQITVTFENTTDDYVTVFRDVGVPGTLQLDPKFVSTRTYTVQKSGYFSVGGYEGHEDFEAILKVEIEE